MEGDETLRVLMSSYACEPGRGSEPGVGWNMAKVMADKVSLSVVTRANNRVVIEACQEEWIGRVEWIYYDPPKWMTWWKKGGRGVQLFYILWQIGVYFRVISLGGKKNYDLIHHVTFGRFWVPSFLSLLGVPFIFGPVGGGEYTPTNLHEAVSKPALRSENLKRKVSWLLTRNPLSRILYRKITLAYSATEQTRDALKKLGVPSVELLPQSGISSDELCHFSNIRKEVARRSENVDFVVCSAARLIPWKGVDLSIRAYIKALPNLPKKSIFKIASTGPELERLKILVRDAGVEDKVIFLGRLPALDDVYRMMASSNCLLHAATSEAFGQACAESLGLGTPVICWDWAGPGLIVNQCCGKAVDPLREDALNVFSEAIVKMSKLDTEEKMKMQVSCNEQIKQNFLWAGIGEKVMAGYYRVLKSDN